MCQRNDELTRGHLKNMKYDIAREERPKQPHFYIKQEIASLRSQL